MSLSSAILVVALCWLCCGAGRVVSDYKALPLLPGLQFIGWGFDAVTGKTAQLQVVKFTFEQGQTFTNPFNSSLVYAVPDQVTVRSLPSTFKSVTSEVYYSSRSIGGNFTSWIEGAGPGVWFGASDEVSFASSWFEQRDQFSSAVWSTKIATLYSATLQLSQLSPTDNFVTDVANLPQQLNGTTLNSYLKFVYYYGTHYLAAGFLGAYGKMFCGVNSDYAQTYSSSSVSVQAGIHFDYVRLGGSGSDAAAWYTSGTVCKEWLYGGEPGIDFSNWEEWAPTFYNFPYLLFGRDQIITLASLTDFIKDQQIAANLQKAIKYYIASHPFPPDPPCMQQVYCSETQACCSQDEPVCYDDGVCCAPRQCDGGQCSPSTYGRCLSVPNSCPDSYNFNHTTSQNREKRFCFDGTCGPDTVCCCLTTVK